MNTARTPWTPYQEDSRHYMGHTQPPCAPSPSRFIVHFELDQPDSLITQRFAFIDEPQISIGRGNDNHVIVAAGVQSVSVRHAEVLLTPDGYVLRDTASRNGLLIEQGGQLTQVSTLALHTAAPGQKVYLGSPGPSCRISVGRVYPFADYLITGQLGQGGMAGVFAAQDDRGLGRLVVLKIVAPRFLLSVDKGEAESMLLTEARLAAQINHPNVVKIHRVDTLEGTPYIEMEYLQGVDLSQICKQLLQMQVRCPVDLAAALVHQACQGLHAAHEARDASGRPLGIVHCDFSPHNMMCSPEGKVQVIDFGIARALGHRGPGRDSAFVGKVAYASPEQLEPPRPVDRRADVFAAGVVFYELLAGHPPFDQGCPYRTMHAVIHDPPPPIAGLPASASALIQRALNKDPAGRPPTAEQLADELEALVARCGGQYLKPKNIAHGLRQLGVQLEAPLPRLLEARPTVFLRRAPQPAERESSVTLKALPPPVLPPDLAAIVQSAVPVRRAASTLRTPAMPAESGSGVPVPTRDPESGNQRGWIELMSPPLSETCELTGPQGDRIILCTLRLGRRGQRSALSLLFRHSPELLPAGIALVRFRDGLAVEIISSRPGELARSRLYSERSHDGTSRVFLTAGGGFFELGSRSQNRLQRIDYKWSEPGEAAIELPAHNLRILAKPMPCTVLLWTREPHSGDLHVCCAQLAD